MGMLGLWLLLMASSVIGQAPPSVACQSNKLTAGEWARVTQGTTLNVRPQPTTTQARVGVVTAGEMLQILGGGRCSEGYIWWEVTTDTADTGDALTGWVAEGDAADNWIEPRGELLYMDDDYGANRPYVRLPDGTVERAGCMRPPEDYDRVQIGYATLNERTIAMLENAQRVYETLGGTWANFRYLLTQGSYNAGVVEASFGTHDAGGAVDISVRNPEDFTVMEADMLLMLEALRVAGFAAWIRDNDELYDGSIIHIHAIAIGDAEASPIAKQQVDSEFGYFNGYNGLPPSEVDDPVPDRYGEPIICGWMRDLGFSYLPAAPDRTPTPTP